VSAPDPEIAVECPLRFCVFTQAGICAEHPDGCPEHSCDWCEGGCVRVASAWEACWYCRGYGVVEWVYGLLTCSECHGECYVRRRDARGRFIRG